MEYKWLTIYYDTIRRLQLELSREVEPGDLVPVNNMRAMIAVHDLLDFLANKLAAYPDYEGIDELDEVDVDAAWERFQKYYTGEELYPVD